MVDPKVTAGRSGEEPAEMAYESPCVESVVTSDEIEREAHYGGGISSV